MAIRVPVKTYTLVASAARTASGNSGVIILQDFEGQKALVELACTAASGTSPTLDVYVQQSLDGGTNFKDMARFAQLTASAANNHYMNLGLGGTDLVVKGAVGDATISASAVGTAPVSNIWRVKWTIGGTNPSFTFAVTAYLG